MIVSPDQGFICTRAAGAAHVNQQIDYVTQRGAPLTVPLATSWCWVFRWLWAGKSYCRWRGCGASTLGVSFEKAPTESKTASAGWYNNKAFETRAAGQGFSRQDTDGDAFSDAMRDAVLETIKADLGQIDLVVYSLASPVRQRQNRSAASIQYQAAGRSLDIKTVHVKRSVQRGLRTSHGARDRRHRHSNGRRGLGILDGSIAKQIYAPNAKTVAYTYIGSELTWPI